MDQQHHAAASVRYVPPAITDADAMWSALLSLYAEPGVMDSCLHLQDEYGEDVLLLLLGVLLARADVALTSAQMAQLRAVSAPWQAEVVGPLRALRRRWREREAAQTQAEWREPLQGLRRNLAQLELAAEREQWVQLLQVVEGSPAAVPGVQVASTLQDRVQHNLQLVLGDLRRVSPAVLRAFGLQ